MTSHGLEPETFRLLAQRLDHYLTVCPGTYTYSTIRPTAKTSRDTNARETNSADNFNITPKGWEKQHPQLRMRHRHTLQLGGQDKTKHEEWRLLGCYAVWLL
jgi:hypothetical protein